MSQQTDKEELAIRYLLGGLSEKDRTSVEERFFADDKEFEELEIAEGELIDRYVRGELSATEQQHFKKMLRTSPRLVERVEFAKILARRVTSLAPQQDDPEPTPAVVAKPQKNKVEKRPWRNLFGPTLELSPAMRVAFVAPLALLLLMSVALVLVWTRLQTQSGRLAAEQQRLEQLKTQNDEQKARNDKLEADLTQANQQTEEQGKLLAEYQQQLENPRGQNPIVPFGFFLNPGSATRGGSGTGETTIRIPAGTRDVELRLVVEIGNYSIYQASLQDIDHKPIVPQRRLRPVRRDGRTVLPFKVAVSLLPPGRSYRVHVDGLLASGEPEDFSDYPFRVIRR